MQVLGGDCLFGVRLGFSGTPSDLLPVELGECAFERGSDAHMLSVLTDMKVTTWAPTGPWSNTAILDMVATSTAPRYHCLIDAGALVTGMTNLQVG